jgi:hypothetical protein
LQHWRATRRTLFFPAEIAKAQPRQIAAAAIGIATILSR